jgi:hypothetical protein
VRRAIFFSFVAFVLVAVSYAEGRPSSGTPEQAQFQQVNIRVSCADGEVDEVSIQPWTARASRGAGQQLRWRLLPGSDIGSASIRPKSGSQWPFENTPPLTVVSGGNSGADSGAITAGPGTYFYDIIVDCGSGPTVLDPRMDIGG